MIKINNYIIEIELDGSFMDINEIVKSKANQ